MNWESQRGGRDSAAVGNGRGNINDKVPLAPTMTGGGTEDEGLVYEKLLGGGRNRQERRSRIKTPLHRNAERMALIKVPPCDRCNGDAKYFPKRSARKIIERIIPPPLGGSDKLHPDKSRFVFSLAHY